MVYKVSFVVQDGSHPGGIQNLDERPTVGDRFAVGSQTFEVLEVMELVPPHGEYAYLHATCRLIDKRTLGKQRDGNKP
jgi:hypothetical protein